jgi:hypothetical protein
MNLDFSGGHIARSGRGFHQYFEEVVICIAKGGPINVPAKDSTKFSIAHKLCHTILYI